jgi:O-antigen/teichoic acid export membrane protein
LSGLTSKAVSGASWMFAATILGRAIAMLGQVGIGWLLTPADFGVWALALSMATAVMALRNGGTTQILVQRGTQFSSEARFFLRYSLLFNTVAATILIGLSMPYLLERSAVGIALLGIGVAVPLATPAMLYRAKLTIEARFRPVAIISLGSSALWQVSVFTLAYVGFGAASFACAPALQAIFETLAGRFYAGRLPPASGSRPAADYRALFRQSSWVMLSGAVLSLGTTGDYFAVGMLTDVSTVGVYYFGFQTVVTLSMPIYSGLESVLPSLLVRLADEPSRQVAAFARALRTVVVTSVPLAITFALVTPFIFHLLWHGKWDMAAHPTQILAACVPAWLITHCIRALLEARGYWRLRFGLLAVNGVGGVSSAAIGTFFGGVANIALTVSIFYVLFGLSLLLSLRTLRLTVRDLSSIALQPLILNCGALALTLFLQHRFLPDVPTGAAGAVSAAIFLIAVAVGNLAMFKQVWVELVQGLADAVRRRSTPTVAVSR